MKKVKIPFKYIEAAMLIAPKQDVRYYLNGVFFDEECIVVTDGHRLLKIKHSADISEPFIVPCEALDTLRKQLTKKQRESDVRLPAVDTLLEISDKYLECAGKVAKWQPVDGTFPEYQRVVPSTNETKLHHCFNWNYMADFQKMNAIFGGGNGSGVSLYTNGERGAKVEFKADDKALGVIMPIRL